MKEILIPQADNFTPPERTPWGGVEIVKRYKRHLNVDTTGIVGESWELSGHPTFPSQVSYKGEITPINYLGQRYSSELFGCPNQKTVPFLVKLLNSGSWADYRSSLNFTESNHALHLSQRGKQEHSQWLQRNLSIQVHPKKGDYSHLPSKTEAWIILDAEEGAGIYLGLKTGVQKEQFAQAMRQGEDLSDFLNFVEVKKGDAFFIPAGTLHAIGAGVLLLEPQETSESTFRAYDWGRPRPLHHEEVLNVTQWDGATGLELIDALRCTPTIRSKEFHHDMLLNPKEYEGNTFENGLQGGIVLDGSLTVTTTDSTHTFSQGQSFFLPANLGKYTFSGTGTLSLTSLPTG